MTYLWNRPANDPDALMYDRICEFTAYCEATLDEKHEHHVNVEVALGQVYHDVFNNGGCNLPFARRRFLELLFEYADEKGIEKPEYEFDPDEDGAYDLLSADVMDTFARQIIRHLYLDISRPVE